MLNKGKIPIGQRVNYFMVVWQTGIGETFTCVANLLCGLVVRVPQYKSRGPGFDSRRFQIISDVAGLERGPLSLVRITEELLRRNSRGFGLENRH
jgi:hypothetical protein